MKNLSYYENHPLKEQAKALSLIFSDVGTLAILAASKKQKARTKFLSLIIDNQEECFTSHVEWVVLAQYPLKFTQKFLKLDRLDRYNFLRVLEMNEEYAWVSKVEDLHKFSSLFSNPASAFSLLEKYPQLTSLKEIPAQSNGVFDSFLISEKSITFKDAVLVPMETRQEFQNVGTTLQSCTGVPYHWEKVKATTQLRFKIMRGEQIVGTLLLDGERGQVYGFEANYVNYSKRTIKDMVKTIIPYVKKTSFDLKSLEHVKHGWGKGKASL